MSRLVGAVAVSIVSFALPACSRADVAAIAREPETTKGTSAPATSAPATGAPGTHAPPAEVDPAFVPDLERAFHEYKAWGRVDDELRWAPWLCRLPEPGRPRMSAAEGGEHGKKLYSLFARDRAGYVSLGSETRPAKGEQIVVKESYLPEVVGADGGSSSPSTPSSSPLGEGDHFDPHTRSVDGTVFRASSVVGLFVVLEKPRGTPGTDDGFVYGTLTPSGKVTSAGRVASCMGCHAQAKHRRLFGPK